VSNRLITCTCTGGRDLHMIEPIPNSELWMVLHKNGKPLCRVDGSTVKLEMRRALDWAKVLDNA
jgi:hypothetical protein